MKLTVGTEVVAWRVESVEYRVESIRSALSDRLVLVSSYKEDPSYPSLPTAETLSGELPVLVLR